MHVMYTHRKCNLKKKRMQLTVVEEELVEFQAFDEITQCLRLERRNVRIANFPVIVG